MRFVGPSPPGLGSSAEWSRAGQGHGDVAGAAAAAPEVAEPAAALAMGAGGAKTRSSLAMFQFLSVVGHLSAKVGPRTVPNGPGLKNAT